MGVWASRAALAVGSCLFLRTSSTGHCSHDLAKAGGHQKEYLQHNEIILTFCPEKMLSHYTTLSNGKYFDDRIFEENPNI